MGAAPRLPNVIAAISLATGLAACASSAERPSSWPDHDRARVVVCDNSSALATCRAMEAAAFREAMRRLQAPGQRGGQR